MIENSNKMELGLRFIKRDWFGKWTKRNSISFSVGMVGLYDKV
jgi:hypothetical protein